MLAIVAEARPCRSSRSRYRAYLMPIAEFCTRTNHIAGLATKGIFLEDYVMETVLYAVSEKKNRFPS
jgi:hypothetical protein